MKTVFTNGCFDVVHRMHVELLEFCKSRGDKVIVGLNSDLSVKRLKGDGRPIFNEQDRKKVLEAFESVDEVFIFEEDTPYELIKKINPDEIVKGGDHAPETVVGNDLATVVSFNYVEEYSTTQTLRKLQKNTIKQST